MDIKILKSVPKKTERLIIGTHNGIFHSDEVLAIAILCLAHKNSEVCIIRTRDTEELKKCDILVDIGGGIFDHHQPGGNGKRENNIPYASAGLIWYYYGFSLLDSFCNSISDYISVRHKIWPAIDDEIISKVDLEDNGFDSSPHLFSFIPNFLPDWCAGVNPDYDNAFNEVLSVVIKILENEIKTRISAILASEKIDSLFESDEENFDEYTPFCNHILELPCQTIPWKESVIKHNKSAESDEDIVNFVIFPYPNGGWAAQCVPPSMEEEFNQRIPFPKEWAGQTDKLPEISGVKDATFCHNGCFFVRANTYLGIRKMCNLAMN